MDTSRTSLLQKTSEQLQPYIKNLSFSRLGDHLGEFKRTFPHTKTVYNFLPQNPFAPLSMNDNDMVRVVMPLIDLTFFRGKLILDSTFFAWLILKRGADDGFSSSWWIHRAKFTPDNFRGVLKSSTWFSAKESKIIHASEENLGKLGGLANISYPDFQKLLNKGISEWVEKSSEARKAVLNNLEELQAVFPVD